MLMSLNNCLRGLKLELPNETLIIVTRQELPVQSELGVCYYRQFSWILSPSSKGAV